jgi:hypothetical protein
MLLITNNFTHPFQDENSFSKTPPLDFSKFSRKILKIIYLSAEDTIKHAGAFLAASVAAYIFLPFAAVPLFTVACAIYFTNLSVRVVSQMGNRPIKEWYYSVLRHVYRIDYLYPHASRIVLIFSLAISPVFPSVRSIAAVIYGIYYGLTIQFSKVQQTKTGEARPLQCRMTALV